MSGLHKPRDPNREPQIDNVGWLFVAFAIVITATAAMITYEANDAMISRPVPQVAAR